VEMTIGAVILAFAGFAAPPILNLKPISDIRAASSTSMFTRLEPEAEKIIDEARKCKGATLRPRARSLSETLPATAGAR
jgi:hypothetical protein